MKKIVIQLALSFFLLTIKISYAQNVGIGISSPQQKLEVNGAIKISSNDMVTPTRGTMRWNNNTSQFEGFDGIQWIKFGSTNAAGNIGAIGDTNHYSYESDIYDSKFATQFSGEHPYFGSNIIAWKDYYISGAPYYFSRSTTDGYDVARAGKVAIFQKSASGKFLPLTNILSPAPAEDNEFGISIAADEQRFIIGEPKAGPIYQQGKVHIYNNTNTVEKTLSAGDAISMDEFGTSVGIKNNFAVVGAPQKTEAGVRRGKFYIFRRNTTDGQWLQFQAFVGTAAGDQLGKAVAITNEFIAVGSPSMTQNGFASHGAVYMYQYNTATGNWGYHSLVKPNDGLEHKGFGSKLVLKGDTLMVAEYPSQTGLKNRLYMFIRVNNVWTQVNEFVLPGTYPGDGAAASFDFKGDRVIIGQTSANIGGIMNGIVHLYEWNGSWVHRTILRPSDPTQKKRFGQALLFGKEDILCGAIDGDGEYDHSGLIYIYRTR